MNRTERTMGEKNIYQRLAEVMKAVGYVQKENKKVNNQYTFVSHDAVTAKLRPALIENGIMPIVTVKHSAQDGNRTEVTILVKFVNIDKPDEIVEVESFGYGIDPQDKGPGKAVSYAFKYALLKTFCLETGDDPERDNIEYEAAPAGLAAGRLKSYVAAIQNAADIEALKSAYSAAYKAAHAVRDAVAEEVLAEAKDARKLELEIPA
jgi:hypothetical protein